MLSQPPIWLILIAFVCALGPLVFFHELGHYLVARWLGVGAETFSIGFGQEVTGWTDRQRNPLESRLASARRICPVRRRRVRCKHAGRPVPTDAGTTSRELPSEACLAAIPDRSRRPGGQFPASDRDFRGILRGLRRAEHTPVVNTVEAGSAAAAVDIKPGDRIISIGGRPTSTFEELRNFVILRPGEIVTVQLQRDQEQRELQVKLGTDIEKDRFGQTFRRGLLGVSPAEAIYQPVPLLELVPTATTYVFGITRTTLEALWQIITGRRSVKELGGPLKIAQVAGQQATLGLADFVGLLAILSINLGFINLLPVPVLDGGHLLFYAIEAVRRRPVSPRAQDWAFRGGLAFILALLIFTTVNDLGSFGVWERLGRLIG